MSNHQNEKPAQPKAEPGRFPIPVRELRFCRPNGLEVPLPSPHGARLSMVNSITAGQQPMSDAMVELSFLPWMRCYRVAYTPSPDTKVAPTSFYIPESWALWIGED